MRTFVTYAREDFVGPKILDTNKTVDIPSCDGTMNGYSSTAGRRSDGRYYLKYMGYEPLDQETVELILTDLAGV